MAILNTLFYALTKCAAEERIELYASNDQTEVPYLSAELQMMIHLLCQF